MRIQEATRRRELGIFAPSLLFIILLSLLLAAGCSGGTASADSGGSDQATPASAAADASPAGEDGSDAGTEDEDGEEAVPVEVASLETGRMEEVLRLSANLEAESHVQVFSQAARLVRELLVEEGDRVRQGQVLLRLQDEEQRNALAKARSQLAKAGRDFDRLERLFNESLISEQEFFETRYQREQMEIAVADAERELGYTEVRAPIAGTVTARMVKMGDQVTVGQHLFDIVDFDSLVARVYVPEKSLARLKPGQPARITAEALRDRRYSGRVDRIAPVVDPKTGTLKVTVAVGGQPGLLPGLYVDVALVTSVHEQALLLPKRALVYDRDRVFVFRLGEDSRVERLAVEPVLSDRNHVEVGEPLRPGDRVVTAGQAGLKDGALVELPGAARRNETPESAQVALASAGSRP